MTTPGPDTPIRVEVLGAGALGARVVRARDGVWILRVPSELAPEVGARRALTGHLAWATPRGLARLEGVLRPAVLSSDRAAEPPELLRFDVRGELDVLQRREFARVEALIGVDVASLDAAFDDAGGPLPIAAHDPRRAPGAPSSPVALGSVAGEAQTLYLSGNGLLVCEAQALALWTRVRLALALPDGGPPAPCVGQVVRDAGEGRRGVRIDVIAEADRERIVSHVFVRQRLAAALARRR